MSENTSTVINVFKLLTGFISDNNLYITVIIIMVIFKNAVSEVLSRLITLTFKNGDSSLDISASTTSDKQEPPHNQEPVEEDIKPVEESIRPEVADDDYLAKIILAFEESRFDDAKNLLKAYSLEENDEVKVEKAESLYFYFKVTAERDQLAIKKLEELARNSKSDESKLNTLIWLSLCREGHRCTEDNIEMWESAIGEIKSQSILTKVVINLAMALNRDGQFDKSKKTLIKRLTEVDEYEQKQSIFGCLSEVEGKLGNKALSIYCKDKSLQYDQNNKKLLFSTAYLASQEKVDDISIANYLNLIRIDRDNSIALNNLGICAINSGFRTEAIKNYKKSVSLGNSFAISNIGSLYLNAGFIEEAEEVAKKSLQLDSTHNNIYKLLSEIRETKEEQKILWDERCKKALKNQLLIRNYTEQYYLGMTQDLEGTWYHHDGTLISVMINNNELEVSWEELEIKNKYKLIGKSSGATFSGEIHIESSVQGVLSGHEKYEKYSCIGFLSGDKNEFIIKSLTDEFSLRLSR